jgi:hypothetical protein
MKAFKATWARLLGSAWLLFLCAVPAFSQGSNGLILYASDFGKWNMPAGIGPATGQIVYSNPDICKVSSSGYNFIGPKVGRPLKIHDGNPSLIETVIPTQVQINVSNCVITAPMAYQHLSYYLESGTAGYQEAIDYNISKWYGGIVALTPQWTEQGGLTGMITAATGGNSVSVIDERQSCFVAYNWSSSTYVLTANFCSGGGSSGPLLQTNSVNNALQTILNQIDGTGIHIVNTAGGNVQFNCNTTSGAGVVGCPFIPLFDTGAPVASCSSANQSQEYYDLNPANAAPTIYICKNVTGTGYTWAPISGGAQTVILVNGVATNPVSPVAFIDSPTITWNLSGATVSATGLTVEHNDSSAGINERILNFDDTTPAAPSGYANVTFQHDQPTGRWSGYVPTASALFQMQVLPPIAGQFAIVYPTGGLVTSDPPGVSSIYGNGSAAGGHFQWQCSGLLCSIRGAVAAHWTGIALPAWLASRTSDITAIYADAITSAGLVNLQWDYTDSYSGTTLECNGEQLMVAQGGYAYAPREVTGLTTLTGANFNSLAECHVQVGGSGPGTHGQQLDVSAIRFLVYYTGTPGPANPATLNIQPPLGWNQSTNTIYLDQTNLPAGHINPISIAELPPAPALGIYAITNGVDSSDCTVGSGSNAHFCGSNGTTWVAFPTGGSGGSVSLSSPSSTLTLSPNPITGTGTLDLNLGHANTWTAKQTQPAPIFSDLSGGGSRCLSIDNSGQVGALACGSGGATAWSGLTNPSGNLALSMGANTTTFTWGASTGSSDLLKLTDTSSNTGTGILLHVTTASGSTETPWQADANGCGWKVDSSGNFVSVCSSSVAGAMIASHGTPPGGVVGAAVYTADATSGFAEVNENNTGLVRICTATNGVCPTGGGGTSVSPNSAIYNGAIQTAAIGVLTATLQTFSSTSTPFWEAAPTYGAHAYAADTYYYIRAAGATIQPVTIKNIAHQFAAAVSSGNLPIDINANGSADVFYSGCQSDHTTVTQDGNLFTPLMELEYYKRTGDISQFNTDAATLKTALQNVPLNGSTHLVTISAVHPFVAWGFHDGIVNTGDDLVGSLYMHEAAKAMVTLYTANSDPTNAAIFQTIVTNIESALNTTGSVLWDSTDGMYYAATTNNHQVDVLGSALAVQLGIASGTQQTAISTYLNAHYATLVIGGFTHQSNANWANTSGGNMCGKNAGNYDDGTWSILNDAVYYALRVNSQSQATQLIADFASSANPTIEWIGSSANGATNNLASPMAAVAVANAQYPGAVSLQQWCTLGGNYCGPTTTPFNQLASGTNTTAAMLIGSGGSLAPTGTGTIQANNILNTISPGSNVTITGSGTPSSPYVINSTASGSGGIPATVGSLVFWFSGDRTIVTNNNDGLVRWLDSSTLSTATVTTNGAIYKTSQVNSQPAVDFTGGSNVGYTISPATTVGSVSVFVVFKPHSLSSPASAFLAGASGSFGFNINTSGHLEVDRAGIASVATDTTTLSTSSWFQANFVYDNSGHTYAFRVNESAGASGSVTATFSAPTTNLGYDSSDGYLANMEIAEVIVYARALSGGEITTIETYLHTKYGI